MNLCICAYGYVFERKRVPVPKGKLLQLSLSGKKASSEAFSKLKAHISPEQSRPIVGYSDLLPCE